MKTLSVCPWEMHWNSCCTVPPQIRQMALRRPVSVSSISKGRSWLANVNTRSVSGPNPALCIWVRFRVRPSEKVMVSCSGVYLVQILRICGKKRKMESEEFNLWEVCCIFSVQPITPWNFSTWPRQSNLKTNSSLCSSSSTKTFRYNINILYWLCVFLVTQT